MRDFPSCGVVGPVKDTEEGELMLLALRVVTSDCHGKMTFRAGKPCNDIQSQGALGDRPPGQAGEGPFYSHRGLAPGRWSPVPEVQGSPVGASFSPVQSEFSWVP